jgi:hypothetical protein
MLCRVNLMHLRDQVTRADQYAIVILLRPEVVMWSAT